MKYSFRDYHLFQLLKRFENQHLPLDLFLNQYFKANKALGAKDRRVIADAVYGMTRWQLLLDYLIGKHPSWEKRFAIYQRFQPTQFAAVESIAPHIRVSCPFELYQLLVADYGQERANYLAQVNNTMAPTTIRINPLKTTRAQLLEHLAVHCEAICCAQSTLGIELKKRIPLFTLPEYQQGLFEIQDEGSQLVAELMQVSPYQQVLDYCAGSGGKTLAFAHRLAHTGQLYLYDIRASILNKAKQRFKRAGIQNAQFLEPQHAQLQYLKGKVDWVLADVPCSGTGTLRRHPEQKWRFTKTWLNELIKTQRSIIAEAIEFLKPGGKLVYVTCSLLKAENEHQVDFFLNNYPLVAEGHTFHSHPTYGGMDGFYAFVFKKT